MKTFQGYQLIGPDDLQWRPSNLMKIPNADYLERTGSENMGARLWRLPPMSANTLHKHIRAEEFYFVLEGTGRIRVGGETLTVPKYGGVLVGPDQLRQVFNDTGEEDRNAVDRMHLGIVGFATREDQAIVEQRPASLAHVFEPLDKPGEQLDVMAKAVA